MSVERIYGVPLIVRSCRETWSVLSAHGIHLQGLLFLFSVRVVFSCLLCFLYIYHVHIFGLRQNVHQAI